MPEDKKNVVSFAERQHQKEEAKAQAENPTQQFEVHPEVKDTLEEYETIIQEMTDSIDKELIAYAKKQKEERGQACDISAPIESLARVMGITAAELDMQIPEEQRHSHVELRAELSNLIHTTLNSYIKDKDTATPKQRVYQQDIYIALAHVLVTFLQQQRVYSFMSQHEKGGADNDTEQDNDSPETE